MGDHQHASTGVAARGGVAEWCHLQPCSTCGADPPAEPSHVRSRGAGGKARDLIPRCWRCHRALHQMGRWSFEREIGVDLEDVLERTRVKVKKWREKQEAE